MSIRHSAFYNNMRRTAYRSEGCNEEDIVDIHLKTGGLVPKESYGSEDIGPSKRGIRLELEENNTERGNGVTNCP
jgi:hypothetical protein